MSAQGEDWGDMVMPGVHMIRRTMTVSQTQKILNPDGKLNLQLIHLKMEELARDIKRLTKSNVEIVYYLSHKDEYKDSGADDDDGGDCSMAAMMATTNDKIEEEDDDEIFIEALQENESVIKGKEAELELLGALIDSQKCGCSAHRVAAIPAVPNLHTIENAQPATQQVPAVPANRIEL